MQCMYVPFPPGQTVAANVARFALMTNDLKVKLQQQQCFTTAQLSVRGLSQNNGENKHLINMLCELHNLYLLYLSRETA